MPLDAICLQAVVEELRPALLGLRIDKVQQPARDQVILLLRGNQRLLLNAGANAPRIQLTRSDPGQPGGAAHVLHAAAQAPGGRPGGRRSDPAAAGAAGAAGAGCHRRVRPPGPADAGAGGHGPPVQPDPAGRGGPHHRLPAPGGRGDVRPAARCCRGCTTSRPASRGPAAGDGGDGGWLPGEALPPPTRSGSWTPFCWTATSASLP